MRKYLEFINKAPDGVEVLERYELFKYAKNDPAYTTEIDNAGRGLIRFNTENGIEIVKVMEGTSWRLVFNAEKEDRPFLLPKEEQRTE